MTGCREYLYISVCIWYETLLLKWNDEMLIKWVSEQFWRCCSCVCVVYVFMFMCLCRRLEKHKNHIVFTFHQLSFMIVIQLNQLSYSDRRMPVKRYYYFLYESVLDFLRESALWLRERMKHARVRVRVFSAPQIKRFQNDVTCFLFKFKCIFTHIGPWNFYFNTLDIEKVQGKCLSCIKCRGDTFPAYCTPTLHGASAEGWNSRMRLVGCRPLL